MSGIQLGKYPFISIVPESEPHLQAIGDAPQHEYLGMAITMVLAVNDIVYRARGQLRSKGRPCLRSYLARHGAKVIIRIWPAEVNGIL